MAAAASKGMQADIVHLSELRTGDLVLFRNKRSLVSDVIAFGGRCKFSHVGMAVVNPPWRTDLRGTFLLESNVEPYRDAEDNEFKCGATLSPLKEVVDAYGSTDIFVRRLLSDHPWTDEDLIKAHSIVHNRPYDFAWSHWLRALLGLSIPPSYHAMWCSALVALIYCHLRLLPRDYDYSAATPETFCEGGGLLLEDGVALGPEQRLDLLDL